MPLPRPSARIVLGCLLAAVVLMLSSGKDPWWSDWGSEALPSLEFLLKGDLQRFIDLSPVYAAGMLLRAPLYLAADALGVGEVALYRAGALPGLLALVALAAPLTALAARTAGTVAAVLVAVMVAANPVGGLALDYGHPEDLAATAGAIGGVLLALHGRTGWAGIVLGLAIAFKQWAVIGVLPAVAAAPERRWRILPLAGGVALAPMLPFFLGQSDFSGENQSAAGASVIFHASQWFWPLGIPTDAPGAPGPLMAPAWLSLLCKPLIVGLSAPLALAYWWRTRRGEQQPSDVLAVLALLFLARCALDPWNIHYYHLPLVVSLVAWETVRHGRLPVLALGATAATWLSFNVYPGHYDTGTYLVYVAWTLPLAIHLADEVLAGGKLRQRLAARMPRTAGGTAPVGSAG